MVRVFHTCDDMSSCNVLEENFDRQPEFEVCGALKIGVGVAQKAKSLRTDLVISKMNLSQCGD